MKIDAKRCFLYFFGHGVSVFCVVVFLFLFVFFVVLVFFLWCCFCCVFVCFGFCVFVVVFFLVVVSLFSLLVFSLCFLFVEKCRGKRCWPPTFDHGELISFISYDPDCYLDWWKGEI